MTQSSHYKQLCCSLKTLQLKRLFFNLFNAKASCLYNTGQFRDRCLLDKHLISSSAAQAICWCRYHFTDAIPIQAKWLAVYQLSYLDTATFSYRDLGIYMPISFAKEIISLVLTQLLSKLSNLLRHCIEHCFVSYQQSFRYFFMKVSVSIRQLKQDCFSLKYACNELALSLYNMKVNLFHFLALFTGLGILNRDL